MSPPGNLHASTLVRLRADDPPAPTLGFVAGVALHESLAAHAPAADFRLKWPNDLVADGAKLAGILLERSGDAVAVGIGANLAHHPDGLDQPATSLRACAGQSPEPSAFLAVLAPRFADRLERWREDGTPALLIEWSARALPVGTALRVHLGEEVLRGMFDGLDGVGALRLRLPDGDVRAIHAGDVFLV